MNRALFIFRRDLRLRDNVALQFAADSHAIIPCFIFDPRQLSERNDFFSQNSFEFMIESLQDLDHEIHKQGGNLYFFYGEAQQILAQLLQKHDIQTVYTTRDYTPFSVQRDAQLAQVCKDLGREFYNVGGNLLHEPEEIYTHQRQPYTVFTPFYRKSLEIPIALESKKNSITFQKIQTPGMHKIDIKHELSSKGQLCDTVNPNRTIVGGRSQALKILKQLHDFKDYSKTRDIPALDTTHLSAHLKFGTVSPREVLHECNNAFGLESVLAKQLYWRDFYTHIAYNFPHVFSGSFKREYDVILWSYNMEHFERWCNGQTGFPIVDAGMRELNTTGFMHNRVRMITASFLTKDLHMNWQLGERYFARRLVDYDPAVNNGNWQWVASTGCDPQPYFRIFNPWLQQKKFDPNCEYIKKWIPELQNIPTNIIHAWDKKYMDMHYPKPMLDHKKQAKIALALYKKN